MAFLREIEDRERGDAYRRRGYHVIIKRRMFIDSYT